MFSYTHNHSFSRRRRALTLFMTISILALALSTLPSHSAGRSTSPSPQQNPINTLPAGHWYEVPNSRLQDVGFQWPRQWLPGTTYSRYHFDLDAVIRSWGGGAYDTKRERLIVWGGGHAGYDGNEIYVFDVNMLRWERLTDPSLRTDPQGILEAEGEYPDANGNPDPRQPRARHTYNYIQYLPSVDKFCSFGSTAQHPGIKLSQRTHCFDFDSKQWERKKDALAFGFEAFSAYDTTTGHVWVHGTQYNSFLAEWDPNKDV